MVKIKIIKKAKERELVDINNLISQMSLTKVSPKHITMTEYKEMLNQEHLFFIVAVGKVSKNQEKIIGVLSVYFVKIPTGLIAWSEDLVIDKPYRKWGVGRLLMEVGIKLAHQKRARHLSLRTNPVREEANKLYQAMGFNLVETNFYRFNLFK
ncbi:MAG: GNAT family N-acetyltransferase [bacterium]|nr:GNAT family N-acetyltransferase [bacterium]